MSEKEKQAVCDRGTGGRQSKARHQVVQTVNKKANVAGQAGTVQPRKQPRLISKKS